MYAIRACQQALFKKSSASLQTVFDLPCQVNPELRINPADRPAPVKMTHDHARRGAVTLPILAAPV
jgi:hypothetical protein